jgi:hypothetical protein
MHWLKLTRQGENLGRTVISEELFHPLAFYLAETQWPAEKLIDTLRTDNTHLENLGDHLLLIDCAEKDYWIQTLGTCGYSIEISHPLSDRGNPLEQVKRLAQNEESLGVFYEYFDPTLNLAKKLDSIGGLRYCEVFCHVRNELALQQALMELIDWFTILMSPIDEVFCRMRNHKGLNEEPDCCTVLLKFADGMEAHWFINALGEGVARGMNFYGDRGVYSWDGGTVNSGVIRRGSWDELVRSYRIADWIRKAARYERSVSYRETKR